jgi:poly(A) polymerase/tRNA nucleotidyltransferase (CCA-adding enzyme)
MKQTASSYKKHESLVLPKEICGVVERLQQAGHEAYIVGGCVRDLLRGKTPKDWDVTTSAKPEEILKLFEESFYENQFLTVTVKTGSDEPTLQEIEVTTFRAEGKYTDKRHPDTVRFAKTLEEDLSRRDFTVNAVAMSLGSFASKWELVDPFDGQADLKKKLIRAVGDPITRFREDALRLLRAVRLAARLGFKMETETAKAVRQEAGLIEFIAKERIRDEMEKLLMCEGAADGIRELAESGLLKLIIPELQQGVGVEQNKHHIYTVFEHNVRSLQYSVAKGFPLDLRLASLLHDVGKPKAREWKNDPRGEKTFRGHKGDWTFYQHQYIGERMTLEIMDRLRFPKEMTEKAALLVREHMFVYDPEIVTLRGVRRLLSRIGPENMDDLMKIREADRIGSGVAKAQPYRLRYLQAMIEKVKKDPVSPKMIKVNGQDVMSELKIEPGPKVGTILSALLEEVLDDPKLNTKDHLLKRVKELGAFSEKELVAIGEKAKKAAVEAQLRIDEELKKKYFVK